LISKHPKSDFSTSSNKKKEAIQKKVAEPPGRRQDLPERSQ